MTRIGCALPSSTSCGLEEELVFFFFLEGLGCGLMQRVGWELGESKRTVQIFSQGTHRWACFCNTKALLLVSPSPLTWSALHPNVP